MHFGEKLRLERVKRGLTQDQMAKELGTYQGKYSRIESGETKKIDISIYRLAKEKFGIIFDNETPIDFQLITPLELQKMKATLLALQHHVALLMAHQSGCPLDESLKELKNTIQINQAILP